MKYFAAVLFALVLAMVGQGVYAQRCDDIKATSKGVISRMQPAKKRRYYTQRIQQLYQIQPHCQALRDQELCDFCDDHKSNAKFDACMMGTSISVVETPSTKKVCLLEIMQGIKSYLPKPISRRRLRGEDWIDYDLD
jgi:hypothetical protein